MTGHLEQLTCLLAYRLQSLTGLLACELVGLAVRVATGIHPASGHFKLFSTPMRIVINLRHEIMGHDYCNCGMPILHWL
jgi:hypothetical protein